MFDGVNVILHHHFINIIYIYILYNMVMMIALRLDREDTSLRLRIDGLLKLK